MRRVIGIRDETKDILERRAPLIPAHVAALTREHGLTVIVQPSKTRKFPDQEYEQAGAAISRDLSECNIVFGVKEVPVEDLQPRLAYCFFSHTIKGQPANMPMLQRMLESGNSLLDFELVKNERGRRLIAFGIYAGYAGMVNTLWAFGRRLRWEGIDNPFDRIRRPHRYSGLAELREALKQVAKVIRVVGLPPQVVPLICGVTGQGRVSRGASELLKLLPTERVPASELPRFIARGDFSPNLVYRVEFRQSDLYVSSSPEESFDHYRLHRYPERFVSKLERVLPYLSLLVNGIYWEPRYPRLVTKSYLRSLYESNPNPRLRVIGDITCDIEGSIEATLRATTIDAPVFVYEPLKDRGVDGIEGVGPVIMAVDKLPTELPRQASESFSEALLPFVVRLAETDFDRSFDQLELPEEFQRAVVAHQGTLRPEFAHLGADL